MTTKEDVYADVVDRTMRAAKPGVPSLQQALDAADELEVSDAYGFAELAVWELGIYGRFDDPVDEGDSDYLTELESAWLEAEAQWRRHVANPSRT